MSEPKPIFFASPQEFYDWLEEHHETEAEVYVGFYKTHTGKRGMTWSLITTCQASGASLNTRSASSGSLQVPTS